ncbi:MAG TPA: hypothetical protein VLS88_03275 [Polyangiales bacterium]|nr:hypothetical protein [Polyangiales bacterium]
MKGVPIMKAKRWTLGVVLAAAVSLWGLIEADASPFSSYVLTDDLSNSVNGVAPEASNWDEGSSGSDSDSGSDGSGSSTDSGGKDNNGHGNNADGVDSSNPSQGKGGPNGAADESCPDPSNCVDDEVSGGGSSSSDSGGKGKGKGKKK